MIKTILLAAFYLAAASGADLKPVIDNQRVTVWDVTWTKGQTNPTRGHDLDAVVMWIAPGKLRMGGRTVERKAGEAFFSAKTDARDQEGVAESGGPRAVIIELKDFHAPPIANKTGYPLAFPRPHVKKLLENDRVIVWSYRWNAGQPTPMHFHDKDVVVAYLEDSALYSTTPDGAKKLTEHKAFDIRFNQANRTHSELLAYGTASAIMTELK